MSAFPEQFVADHLLDTRLSNFRKAAGFRSDVVDADFDK
jgi:hypothetical protein